ncbi:MAG: efflux family protein [Chitinophagaceae bacterium]|jgi:putative MATE family efflux protein|nr:efflux family protein [Chitinophagaceae bacterium]
MTTHTNKRQGIFSFIKQSLSSEHQDFTKGSMRRAVILLAIPMILEMSLESVFAVVDTFFVSKLGTYATSTVGLAESVITIVYSIAIGLSMAATAMVARRVGEKNHEEASRSGAQAIMLALGITVIISVLGAIYAGEILAIMGGSEEVVTKGTGYTRILLSSSVVIMLLFMINGVFRGAGNAAIAMKSLWIANIFNIILNPLLINGWAGFPELGLEGSAVATLIGRGVGVIYQVYHLLNNRGIIRMKRQHFLPAWNILKSLINVASTATLQFLIASASWMVLIKIISRYGDDVIAGYTIAIRLIVFFILPAWGLSNAAATLVGQNLGANQPERAERSVWKVAKYNTLFMAFVSLFFLVGAEFCVGLMTKDEDVINVSVRALRIVSLGYIFYGVGMVMMNAFNGAGDSRTPTWINLFGFWAFQIPLAYWLAVILEMGPTGVFIAIVTAETAISIAGVILFRRGRWKKVKI